MVDDVLVVLAPLRRRSASEAQAIINFKDDACLDALFWSALHRELTPPGSKFTCDDLKEIVIGFFTRHPLKGRAVRHASASPLYGNAIVKPRFLKLFERKGSGFLFAEGLEAKVDRLLGGDMSVIKGAISGLPLRSGGIMWATFCAQDPDADPFGDVSPLKGSQVCCRLGLDAESAREDLVLLTYRLPADTIPCKPTVADAYSSAGWSYYFRPSMGNDPCGWTMPWPTCAGPPKPEVVHAPIPASELQMVRLVSP
jgi:hypothetical protein